MSFVNRNGLVQNILNFKPTNERTCYIRKKGLQYNISIISAHAPEEEKDEDMRILCRDFNAKFVKELSLYLTIGRYSLQNISNDN